MSINEKNYKSNKLLKSSTLKMSTKTKIPRKPCLVLKIWDGEFNRENESRQAKINLFIYYPVSEINGTPSEEVKLKKKLNKFA